MHGCKCILQIKLSHSNTYKQEHTLLSANHWILYIKYSLPHNKGALCKIHNFFNWPGGGGGRDHAINGYNKK